MIPHVGSVGVGKRRLGYWGESSGSSVKGISNIRPVFGKPDRTGT